MAHLARAVACTAVFAVAGAAGAAADPLPERSARVVDYRIAVTLDPDTKQLDGQQQVTWRNPSTEPVGDLWFHLYLNAFKNANTTFFRESGGQVRGDRAVEGRWGWIDITGLRVNGGPDVKGRGRFERPDDGNADDQTVWRLPLETPVPPGGSVTLDIAFTAQLPRVFARTGYADDYFLVAQWFPKLGVYEPAGMRGRKTGGWNCHQFHATSEFYADFGTYRVEITLPARFVVGATGVRTGERTGKDGQKTYTYEQADIHDFAWTADPRFIEVRRTFSATADVAPAEYEETARRLRRSVDEVKLSDVEIILLIHAERRPQIERHIRAAKAGIKNFGLWYGRYPYPTLTVVDPATGGGGSGGMEYPTFITAGTSLVLNYWPFSGLRAPEIVTVHEFGHQFWYGLVANNEFEEAWLDEGINSYSTGRVLEAEYGRDATIVSAPGLRVSEADSLRMQHNPNQKFNVIVRPAWAYTGDYGFYAYSKPEIVLRTLENHLGRDVWARVMRTYHERWRFRHPSTRDFVSVVNEVAGQDMRWFLEPALHGTEILDYEISAISSIPAGRPRGVFDQGDGARVTKKLTDPQPEDPPPPVYENTLLVRRRGEMVMPVEIDVKFAGKPVERVTWDGRDRWKRFVFTRPERIEWANLDPDRKLELDVDWLNNARRVEPDARVQRKLTGSLMFFVQTLLAWLGA